MKSQALILVLAIVASARLHAADVTGKVTLKGAPPANPPINHLKSDEKCSKLHADVPKMPFYVVGTDGALADVVVCLKSDSLKGKSTGKAAQPLVIDQVGCQYIPYVSAVQTGQKILVRNSDPVLHNVHPIPNGASGNEEYNKAQMPKGPDLQFVYNKPEEFLKFTCDVHKWMFSYVTVVDHPYFAVTDKEGAFTIKNVPPGKYKIEAIHRKAGKVAQEIEVKDQALVQNFTLEAK